jgi:hypothetical protein
MRRPEEGNKENSTNSIKITSVLSPNDCGFSTTYKSARYTQQNNYAYLPECANGEPGSSSY